MFRVEILGIAGLPEVQPGADLAALIAAAVQACDLALRRSDVVVVTQKVVSKAENRFVRLADVRPSSLAEAWGRRYGRDPRLVEVVLRTARRVVRMDRGIIIAETQQGVICANAGVDSSNVEEGSVLLLPENPDASARRIRAGLESVLGVAPAVIVSDSVGRPWREGIVNIAIGVAGMQPLRDYRGVEDTHGRLLHATVMAEADELASAAELVMGKTRRVPVAIVRGVPDICGDGQAAELLRPPDRDLFR
jgi:coenzyme F420-0:L-glutamate ligase/coenzyme F420-1:gamma-L-glutamate ligase